MSLSHGSIRRNSQVQKLPTERERHPKGYESDALSASISNYVGKEVILQRGHSPNLVRGKHLKPALVGALVPHLRTLKQGKYTPYQVVRMARCEELRGCVFEKFKSI